MATSKGRSSGGSKSAPAKKSSGGSRGSAPSKAAASRGGKATAAKKSASPSSSSRSGGGASASSASRGGASRSAGTGTKATATSATGGGGAASKKTATKSVASRSGAASKSAGASRSGGGASRSSAASSRKAPQQRTDGRPLSANDLEKAFKDLLKDIYYAEKKLKTALGKMSKAAQHADLKEAFTVHQGQTDEQISKLDGVFGMLGMKPVGKKCAAMDGLLEEGDEHMEDYEKGPGRDAALIVGAQKVEHYEMAAYGSLRNFANIIGETKAAGVFEEILQQETDTDELLTSLSDTINRMAYGAHNDQGSDKDEDSSRSKGGRGNNSTESGSGSSGSSKSSNANASRQADKDMEGNTEGDGNNRGGGGEMDASAGSDDTGRGRSGSSMDDADTGSNR